MSRAYKTLFQTQAGHDDILPDLAEFCHAAEPAPLAGDLFVQGRFEGRRDVWLRIQEMTQLNADQILELLTSRSRGA